MPAMLIVDDDIQNTVPLATFIRSLGEQAECVTSGAAALEFLKIHPTKLILLDIMMPEMSGFEFLAQLRKLKQFFFLPVVMYSALSDPETRQRAMAAGAQGYVVKGASLQELEAVVRRYAR